MPRRTKNTQLIEEYNSCQEKCYGIFIDANSEYKKIVRNKEYSLSPTSISSLLGIIQKLKICLDEIFAQNGRNLEDFAWLILNISELVLKIGEPLIWLNCGKYVSEYLVFTATCLDCVINLSTPRHTSLRAKLYSTAFVALLTQDSLDEAHAVLNRFSIQIDELRNREEIDPPVPSHIQSILVHAEMDIAVMRSVLSFWKDPEFKLVNDAQQFGGPKLENLKSIPEEDKRDIPFVELSGLECIRIHQLTAGNSTEARVKRCTNFIKAFMMFTNPNIATTTPSNAAANTTKGKKEKAAADKNKNAQQATDNNTTIATQPTVVFSNQFLFELLQIVMFDQIDNTVLNMATPDIINHLWTLVDKNGQLPGSSTPPEIPPTTNTNTPTSTPSSVDRELAILKQLHRYISSTDTSSIVIEAAQFLSQCHDFIHCDIVYRRKSLLRHIVITVWSNCIYSNLQKALSKESSDGFSYDDIQLINKPLLSIIRTLDIIGSDDVVFASSLAVIATQSLKLTNERRLAISVAHHAIDVLDNHRASRVDVAMNKPGEVEDILALQHQSFSTRIHPEDWFHSDKRLGAHMFAGYSIFGSASSANRMDQALAEIHTDLLALYFRLEIEYGVEQRKLKLKHKKLLEVRENEIKLSALGKASSSSTTKNVRNSKSTANVATSATSSSAIKPTVTTAMTTKTEPESDEIVIDKLPCIVCLRCYCSKSGYGRSLLLLEMARAETSEERRIRLLRDAQEAIQDVTEKEEALRKHFYDIAMRTQEEVKHPIVLSRSHRFVYIAPVLCELRHRKASYFRVLARDEGVGINISLANDSLPGCDVRINVSEFTNPALCAVPITSLRRGDRYIFATAAYTADDKLIGEISPSTPISVEAVNPLPIPLLWIYFTETAADIQLMKFAKIGADTLSSYFFHNPTVPLPRTVGRGINLFFTQEPSLCMLTIHNSSDVIISGFIRTFLTVELPANAWHIIDDPLHWHMKKTKQIEWILRIRRTAVMTGLACQMNNYELIIRCVSLGYELASDLLKNDETTLSTYLLQPLLIFAAATQTIPLKYWTDTEHILYNTLVYHITRCGILSYNINPVQNLLQSFHNDLPKSIPAIPIFSQNLQTVYASLVPSLKSLNGLMLSPPLDSQLQVIFGVNHDIKLKLDIWSLTSPQRLQLLRGGATALVGVIGAAPLAPHIESAIREEPPTASALLEVLVFLVRELLDAGQSSQIPRLFSVLPIYDESLAPPVKQICAEWGLNFIQKGVRPPAPVGKETKGKGGAGAGAAGAKDSKGGKTVATPTQPEVPVEKPPVVFTQDESKAQLYQLATLTSLLINGCFLMNLKRNSFPMSTSGPLSSFIPEDIRYEIEMKKSLGSVITSESNNSNSIQPFGERPASPILPLAVTQLPSPGKGSAKNLPVIPFSDKVTDMFTELKPMEFVNYTMSLFTMLLQSQSPVAAVNTGLSLWNYILDEWFNPKEFSEKFAPITKSIIIGMEAFIGLLEILKEVYLASLYDIDNPKNNELIQKFSCTNMEIKEFLFLLKDFLSFMLQVIWFQEQLKEVVDFGCRIIEIYVMIVPDYCKKIGVIGLPLVTDAQQQIIMIAENNLQSRKSELENFIYEWEEAQKKMRKKKMRIARIEKTEEELQFEADQGFLQEKVTRAQAALTLCSDKLEAVRQLEREFNNLSSTGKQMLETVRRTKTELMNMCEQFFKRNLINENKADVDEGTDSDQKPKASLELIIGESQDHAVCLRVQEIHEKLADVTDMYDQLASFLRDRRDYITLLDTLQEQGNLLILFGKYKEVRTVWNDVIDGVFSVMDACSKWKQVTTEAISKLDDTIVRCAIPLITILGKLSKFCCSRDGDMKAQYCRMAAELCRIPFMESIAHPQKNYGFAAYICRSLGGPSALTLTEEKCFGYGLHIAFEEILTVLLAEKQPIAALPVAVLLEFFHAVYTERSNLWLKARILRIRLLLEAKFISEALSMLSGIQSTISTIEDKTYANPIQITNSSQLKWKAASEYDTHESGLLFFQCAPYWNHLPPHDDKNKLALEWVKSYPKSFSDFSTKFRSIGSQFDKPTVDPSVVPAGNDTKSGKGDGKGKDKGTAGAAKGGRKSSGGTLAPITTTENIDPNSVPKFSKLLEHLLTEVCALVFLTVSEMNTCIMSTYHPYLLQQARNADELISTVLAVIDTPEINPSDSSGKAEGRGDTTGSHSATKPDQIELSLLLHRCKLTKCRILVYVNELNLKAAYKALDVLGLSLRSLPQLSSGDLLAGMSQLWFRIKDKMVIVLERFGRLQEVVSISTQGLTEASKCCCGHWFRKLLAHRAVAHCKLGNQSECLSDCENIIASYDSVQVIDTTLIRILVLKAFILRQIHSKSSPNEYLSIVKICLDVLRRARILATQLADEYGFLGVDANLTFNSEDSMIMNHHLQPPAIHNLSDNHDNFPPLALRLGSHKKNSSTHQRSTTEDGFLVEEELQTSNGYKYIDKAIDDFRLGPVDKEEVYAESPYANLYLESVRSLLLSNCALASVLDDTRLALAAKAVEDPELDSSNLLMEESVCCEEGLKAVRHTLYAPPYAHIALLIFAGKTRVSLANKGRQEIFNYIAYLRSAKSENLISPLLTALELSVEGVHPWETMRTLSVELLECFGNKKLEMTESDESRLQLALAYLQQAVKIDVQRNLIMTNNLNICLGDKTFSDPCSGEVLTIMVGVQGKENINTPPPAGKGANEKSKAQASAVTADPSVTPPTGRDALFFLSSLIRETDSLWLDGFEFDIRSDLQLALKKNSSYFASNCCIPATSLPTVTIKSTPPTLSINSIYTIWITSAMKDFTHPMSPPRTVSSKKYPHIKSNEAMFPSDSTLYDGVTGYFLCGIPGAPEDTKATRKKSMVGTAVNLKNKETAPNPSSSLEPILKKFTIARKTLVSINKSARRISASFPNLPQKPSADSMKVINQDFLALIELIITSFQSTSGDDEGNPIDGNGSEDNSNNNNNNQRHKIELVPDSDSFVAKVTMSVISQGSSQLSEVVCSLPITKISVTHIAEVFSIDKACDGIVDGPVCTLVRMILGHQ